MEKETLAARELKRALFKKCHGLSLLTGCSVFIRIIDAEDGIQFYGTKDQVSRYMSSRLSFQKHDQEVSGETGLPKPGDRNYRWFGHGKHSEDSQCFEQSKNKERKQGDDLPNSTTNIVTSSDSGHSSNCEVISISDESNSETEYGDLTRLANLTEDSQKKFEGTSEQIAEAHPYPAASNKDSSHHIRQRRLQIRDVMKEIIKRHECKQDNSNVQTATNESTGFFREKLTEVMIRRALLEQISEEERSKEQDAAKSNLEKGSSQSSGDVPRQEAVKNMQASRENFLNVEKNEKNHHVGSQQDKSSCMQTSERCEDILESELTKSQHAKSGGEETSVHTTTDEPCHRNDTPVPSFSPKLEVSGQLHPCHREQHAKDRAEQWEPLDFSRKRPAEKDPHGAKLMKTTAAVYTVPQHDHEDKAEESNGSSNDEASPDSEASSEFQFYDVSTKAKRRYQCGLCGKAFTQLSVLKEHVKTHTGEKPYTCKICGKEFSHPSNFKRHERLVHSGPHETRRHQCPVCFKAFPLSHHLKEHFRIHSGERPYQCKTCGQRFKQSSTLKTHQKRHNGSSPTHNSSQQVSSKLAAPHPQALSPNPQARSPDSEDGRLVVKTYPCISPTMSHHNLPKESNNSGRPMQSLPYMETLQSVLLHRVSRVPDTELVQRVFHGSSSHLHQPPSHMSHWYRATSEHQSFIQRDEPTNCQNSDRENGSVKEGLSPTDQSSSADGHTSPKEKTMYPPPLIHLPSRDHREAMAGKNERCLMPPNQCHESSANRSQMQESNTQSITLRALETQHTPPCSSPMHISQNSSPSSRLNNSNGISDIFSKPHMGYPSTKLQKNANQPRTSLWERIKLKLEPDEKNNLVPRDGTRESAVRDKWPVRTENDKDGEVAIADDSDVEICYLGENARFGATNDNIGVDRDDLAESGNNSSVKMSRINSDIDNDSHNLSPINGSININNPYSPEQASQDRVTETHPEKEFMNRFLCSVCNKNLSCAATLREHQRVCHGVGQAETYLCQRCGRGFSNHSNFKRHQRLMHNDVKVRRHQCPVCFKAFPLGHHLKEHFRIHSGERPYKCDICGKGFTQSSTLKNHKKTHPIGTRDFQCDICELKCDSALALVNHRMIHIINSCQCPGCGKKCNSPHELAVHRVKEYCPARQRTNSTGDSNDNEQQIRV
ncbi:zinc finger protein 184-like [Ptychodera flava]|uniref:zinc finger protein 184-like n=1 Tax=Ptychodera flava TaxID=63121 RepID=UPI00396A79BD